MSKNESIALGDQTVNELFGEMFRDKLFKPLSFHSGFIYMEDQMRIYPSKYYYEKLVKEQKDE